MTKQDAKRAELMRAIRATFASDRAFSRWLFKFALDLMWFVDGQKST